MKHKFNRILKHVPGRKPKPEESLQEAIQSIPRITNETVAEHREEVLSSARKYIYPLQHSLRRIVAISASIFAALLFGFFVYCVLALYRFDSTSIFVYRVTQVLPFPVARSCGQYVSYENYLFELRHYIHYYQTQQKVDFNSDSGRQQLAAFRKVALQSVVNDACVKKLAAQNHIGVSSAELTSEISLLRSQNRLGSSSSVFEDVLKEFWGWSLDDFKRELKNQILAQKVVSALDTDTHNRAQNVLNQLNNGGDFAALAQQYSEDPGTKASGGDYGITIDKTNRDLPPQVVDELFKLQAGQTSPVVETPLGLEILKARERDGDTVRASHIYFAFKPISTYLAPLEKQSKPKLYITP
ncbi:MAG TPA: peptidylprolyl isomerase [Candidatus Saccharimonadales bacterium]|nr:peptidylprolyl isomerase [Candidatus Saccharimonadales bacterium]